MKNDVNNESKDNKDSKVGEAKEEKEEKNVHWKPVARLNPLEKMPVGVRKFHEQYKQTWNIKEHRKDDEYR